jgi:hypothetical protein
MHFNDIPGKGPLVPIGGWVDPKSGLDAGARRKILCPCRGSNPGPLARNQTLYYLSYCGYSLYLLPVTIKKKRLNVGLFNIDGSLTILWKI